MANTTECSATAPSLRVLMGESLPWDSVFRLGDHHYADYFMRQGCSIFWISPRNILGYAEELLGYKRGSKELFTLWNKRRKNLDQGGLAYSPLTFLPYGKRVIGPLFPWTARNYLRFTRPRFKKNIVREKIREVDVAWLSNPLTVGLLNQLKYRKLVFRIADNFKGFRHIPDSIEIIESELLSRADIIFATARSLLEKARNYNPEARYLPNAVDYGHFANFKGGPPIEYQEIDCPRIVFVGGLSEWIDTSILKEVALKLPRFALVLIGPIKIDLSFLRGLPNVFILGRRSYRDLPGYLRYANVGIIPFKNNLLTGSSHPVKLYEYFASGLPVVTTNLEEVRAIDSPAMLADDKESFAEMVLQAFEGGKNKKEFYQFGAKNSWSERFKIIRQLVLERL